MRLIDADALEKRMANYARDCYEAGDTPAAQIFEDVVSELQDAPTVDHMKHGRWEHHLMPLAYKCSVCGGKQGAQAWKFNSKNYCPECGAKMDL